MRTRALLLPLVLAAGCSGSPEPVDTPTTPTRTTSELTVIAWSDHLQRAVPATGTLTFVDDGSTVAIDTGPGPAAATGQTISGLEPGRYRVSFRHRQTGAKPKGLDGEEAVYLEPGERRTVTVVVVDRKDDIGLLDKDTLPASSNLSRVTRRG